MKLFLFTIKPSTLSVALTLWLLAGCSTGKLGHDTWKEDKELVLQSLQDVHVNSVKIQKKMDLFDQRILALEKLVATQDAQVAALGASATGSQKKNIVKQKKKAKSLSRRLDILKAQLQSANKQPEKKQLSSDEKNAYTAAYLALKSGRYDEASAGFVAVIKAHPKGEYTDQAYYWLGESLVAQKRPKEALESFSVLANKYETSPKHAAALLKMASIYQSMKRTGDAKASLKRVIKEYPDTKVAERARIQLVNLSSKKGARK